MTTLATVPPTLAEYVKQLASANPAEAVQIALAEAERERSIAAAAQAEYRALAEVSFDEHGRIQRANLGGLWRLAQMYAGSLIVPKHYQQKPNDCFIACQMAYRLRVDPFAYMQASYVVHGKPGIEAKLSIAMLNTSDKITGRVRYREEKDDKGVMTACTAYAFDKETGEEVSARITMEMAKAEGWVGKEGSKWRTMPEIMFHYRSATFLIRQYYPEVLMGMRTVDELEDVGREDDVIGANKPARNLNDLAARLEGPANGNGESDGATVNGVVETSDLPDPQTMSPDSDPLLLDDVAAGFRACTTLEEVGKFEAEANGRAKADSDKGAIAGMAEEARERIRSSRGQRAGGKQKELAAS